MVTGVQYDTKFDIIRTCAQRCYYLPGFFVILEDINADSSIRDTSVIF